MERYIRYWGPQQEVFDMTYTYRVLETGMGFAVVRTEVSSGYELVWEIVGSQKKAARRAALWNAGLVNVRPAA